jgi:hypothetical protein
MTHHHRCADREPQPHTHPPATQRRSNPQMHDAVQRTKQQVASNAILPCSIQPHYRASVRRTQCTACPSIWLQMGEMATRPTPAKRTVDALCGRRACRRTGEKSPRSRRPVQGSSRAGGRAVRTGSVGYHCSPRPCPLLDLAIWVHHPRPGSSPSPFGSTDSPAPTTATTLRRAIAVLLYTHCCSTTGSQCTSGHFRDLNDACTCTMPLLATNHSFLW